MTKTSLEPAARASRAGRRRRWVIAAAAVVMLVAAGFATLRLVGPLPAPQVIQTLPAQYVIPGTPPVLPWPHDGQAVIEIEGLGQVGSSGGTRPMPIASVAKVMTAYQVVRDHPLRAGEDGPTLTVSAAEAAEYPAQMAAGQSLVKVAAGEVLTERQALEALLLPSANNIAQILARWDAGSRDAFVTKMNRAATELGMAHTHYTDPSGFDPTTVSTAADQVILGRAAMKQPALSEIVAMPQATIPVAGQISNVNSLLGQDGIVGIKTGSTDQAGGCLVFAADIPVAGDTLHLLGAVLGPGPALEDAFTATQRLVRSGSSVLHQYRVVRAGQIVADVRGPLGSTTALAAANDLDVIGWPGLSYRLNTQATVPDQIAAAAGVGTLRLTTGETAITGDEGAAVSTAIQTTGALMPPSWWHKMTRR